MEMDTSLPHKPTNHKKDDAPVAEVLVGLVENEIGGYDSHHLREKLTHGNEGARQGESFRQGNKR